MVSGREVVGYSYFVVEDRKGLIGDLYVRRPFASPPNEARLFSEIVGALVASREVDRIESQLLMAHSGARLRMPAPRLLRSFERDFMLLNFADAPSKWTPRRPLRRPVYIERWSEQFQESAAQLIASAYKDHLDSAINDQYRSPAGARRFLFNIVQYPGCGLFFRPGSFAAFAGESGRMVAMCLASMVAPDCGHITQICVSPEARGMGLGFDLLCRSLAALRDAGARETSLTVTASNTEAIRLYESLGFVTIRKFSAYVWEGLSRTGALQFT